MILMVPFFNKDSQGQMTTLTPRHRNVGVDSGKFTEGIIMLLTSGLGDSDDNDNDFSQTPQTR